MSSELKVGSRIRDNDPRMNERTLVVTAIIDGRVFATVEKSLRGVRINSSRIFCDNKPRKYGFNVIYN